jgi:hemoglobin/transferrin/lactoferrin receptor protein
MPRIVLFLLGLSLPFLAFPQTIPRTFILSGNIVSEANQTPMAGVTVQVPNSRLGTTTDAQGTYKLALDKPGTYRVQFSSVGFSSEARTVQVDDSLTILNVGLQATLIQLNDQVVVTAQRYETPSFERPEALTVVSSRDLARNALRSTPEALEGQSGVFVQKTNHGGGSPFVRGLTGQQTLLLVDGIRLNNATFRSGPNQYLNTVDPFLLNRVEIVRGSGSVQYGSDALGGTINVLTSTPDFSDSPEFHGSVVGKLASGGMEKSGRIALGASGPKVAVQGGFSYRNFGDLVGGKGIGKQTPTGYDQYSFDVKSLFQLTPNLRLAVSLQHLRQDDVPVFHKIQLENFVLNQFDPQIRSLAYARLEGKVGTPWLKSWQITPLVGRTEEGRQSRKRTAERTLLEKDEIRTYGLLASLRSEPTRFWTIQTGAEWYYDRVNSQKQEVEPIWSSAGPQPIQRGLYPDNATMSNLAFYTLHSVRVSKWTLTAGGRFNTFAISIPDADLGTSTLTPSAWVGNAGVSYALLPSLKIVANANTSFRAPNIDDLGTLGIVDFRFEIPNTTLKPERGFSKEIGVKLKTSTFSASAFAYHNQLTNLIGRIKTDEIRQGYPVYLKENIAKAFIRGLEADAEWQLMQKWLLAGLVNYTYGQNVSAHEPYRRIPPLNGKVALRYQPRAAAWARLELYTAAQQNRLAKGDQDDNRIPEGGTPGWKVVNAAAGYQIGKIRLSAELQNIFNEAYRTHGSGVSGVGRSVWLMARFDW